MSCDQDYTSPVSVENDLDRCKIMPLIRLTIKLSNYNNGQAAS